METSDMAEDGAPLGKDVGGESERGEREGVAGRGVLTARADKAARRSAEEGVGGTKSRCGSLMRGGNRAGKRLAPASRTDWSSGKGGGEGVRAHPQFQQES